MLNKLKFDCAPVLVTGGGQGIGRSTCEVLAELGAHVIVVSKTRENVLETEKILGDMGASCEGHVTDVSDKAQVDALAAAVAANHDRVKALVNNAGTNFVKKLEELEEDDWHRIIGIDLSSVYYMSKAFLPLLRKADDGASIVNVASTFGIIGHPEMPVYCAAKGGVLSLTRQLAVDYGGEKYTGQRRLPGCNAVTTGEELYRFWNGRWHRRRGTCPTRPPRRMRRDCKRHRVSSLRRRFLHPWSIYRRRRRPDSALK
jgi:NAD(P)-dependent dehydrogenase (short-subunit alcohol dehydrogenase family)